MQSVAPCPLAQLGSVSQDHGQHGRSGAAAAAALAASRRLRSSLFQLLLLVVLLALLLLELLALHDHQPQVDSLHDLKRPDTPARTSQSGGTSRRMDGGGLAMRPHSLLIGAFAQPHVREAFQPERSGVHAASATPQPLSPSMSASTISVRPGRLKLPSGISPSCGRN